MNLVQSIKGNPLISAATAFMLLAGTITGTLTATGQLDMLIMTHMEHDTDFVPLAENVEAIRAWQQCDRLERRMVDLEDRKWKYQQAVTVDAGLIRDVDTDIAETRRAFNALNCAEILA